MSWIKPLSFKSDPVRAKQDDALRRINEEKRRIKQEAAAAKARYNKRVNAALLEQLKPRE